MKTIARVASLFAAAFLSTTPRAAVLVVNTTADTSGACAPASCSLREAINAANLTPELDEIHFNIPGAGPHEIVPTSLLPDITTPVTIDGYTQPGSKPNTMVQWDNSIHKIVLRWSSGARGWGLRFESFFHSGPGPSGSTLRGLVIHSFDRNVYLLLGKPNPIVIEGNFLGTDASGVAYGATGVGNGVGIVVQYSFNGAPVVANSRIGGLDPADRNVISVWGNSYGILIGPANGTVIQGNFIGVDASGNAALGNGTGGIYCYPCDEITIGGDEKGARNVIAGNGGEVFIYNSAGGAKIQGNYIGTDSTGRTRLGGNGTGVNWYISNGTTVGGTAPGEGNVIAYNNIGVGHAANGGGAGNRIRGNSIHDSRFAPTGLNTLGIDIRGDGITANDACEANPSSGQNFPVLTAATVGASGITIDGSLNSAPGASFTLDFYASASCDPSGHGEGAMYLGSTTVTTAGDCIAQFSVPLSGSLPPGSSIAATAIDAVGNTSEFSACTALSGNGGASGAVPDGSSAGTVPLTVGKSAGNDLTLSWDDSCTAWDDDYEVLEGDLGSWYSHVPVVCSTGGQTTASVDPAAGDNYYLVVPTNGTVEGSHGLDGTGAERPQGLISCHAQLAAPCP